MSHKQTYAKLINSLFKQNTLYSCQDRSNTHTNTHLFTQSCTSPLTHTWNDNLLVKQVLPFHITLTEALSLCPCESLYQDSLLPSQQHVSVSDEKLFEGAVIKLDRSLMYRRLNIDLVLYLHSWYRLTLDFANQVWHLYWNSCKIERNSLHERWQYGLDRLEAFWDDMIWHLRSW